MRSPDAIPAVVTGGPGLQTAAEHWRELVRKRVSQQVRMLSARTGGRRVTHGHEAGAIAATAPPWWFARGESLDNVDHDPMMCRLRAVLGPTSTVIDIGSGTGRFALRLAPHVAEVTAVDESEDNLIQLRHHAARLGVRNIRTIRGRWGDVEVDCADVAYSSYVLPLVEDGAGFLAKLDRAAGRLALVYFAAVNPDSLFDPFWCFYHGETRNAGASYLDAEAVLAELGVPPDIEIVEVPIQTRFTSLAQATDEIGEYLVLPATDDVRTALQNQLARWLVAEGGTLRPPMKTYPAVIISWHPGTCGESSAA